MNKPENPPAFPIAVPRDFYLAEHGMKLRDYFAGRALAGYCANPSVDDSAIEGVARACYELADAMLAERAKSEGQQ